MIGVLTKTGLFIGLEIAGGRGGAGATVWAVAGVPVEVDPVVVCGVVAGAGVGT